MPGCCPAPTNGSLPSISNVGEPVIGNNLRLRRYRPAVPHSR
jgi:hypothetical protein